MTYSLRTKDNNNGVSYRNLYPDNLSNSAEKEINSDLQKLGNKSLLNLINNKEAVLTFPPNINQFKDDIEKSHIFSYYDEKLITYNLMGYIGINNTHLTISSRFYEKDNDYFLHYMLQRVLSLNIVDLKTSSGEESIYDFMIYLFPYYLKRAINQGLYKEYIRNDYNDANVKGAINVPKHIRLNNPFLGKIAYSTREHSYDNKISQLIRHTIEYIKSHKFGAGVLEADTEIYTAVNQIFSATGSYSRKERYKIIQKNIKIVNHPYYFEYEPLRKICLQILRHEELNYEKEKDKIYGILFDGAWLWEEYLNTLLKSVDFIHPENKSSKNPIYLFNSNKYARYPDFYSKDKEIVMDAKYKHLEKTGELDRNDIHQIISYMYVLKSLYGIYLYPYSSENISQNNEVLTSEMGILNGFGDENNCQRKMIKIGFPIPQNCRDFTQFTENIKNIENQFLDEIHKFALKT